MSVLLKAIEGLEKQAHKTLGGRPLELALKGLEGLERLAPELEEKGPELIEDFLARLRDGDVYAARAVLAASSFDEVIDELDKANEDAVEQIDEEARWSRVLEVIGEVSLEALQVAIPLALAAL